MKTECLITGMDLIDPYDSRAVRCDFFLQGNICIFNGCGVWHPMGEINLAKERCARIIEPEYFEKKNLFILPASDVVFNGVAMRYMLSSRYSRAEQLKSILLFKEDFTS